MLLLASKPCKKEETNCRQTQFSETEFVGSYGRGLPEPPDCACILLPMPDAISSTGLLIFLPLLSATIGALIGAFANGRYRDWQDKKARNSERRGLITLISVEVLLNDILFRTGMELSPLAQRFDASVWEQSKVRLAELLPTNELMTLVEYYGALKQARDIWSARTGNRREAASEADETAISHIRGHGKSVIEIGRGYVKDPQFAQYMDARFMEAWGEEAS
jgi:hypothetical protein